MEALKQNIREHISRPKQVVGSNVRRVVTVVGNHGRACRHHGKADQRNKTEAESFETIIRSLGNTPGNLRQAWSTQVTSGTVETHENDKGGLRRYTKEIYNLYVYK